MSAQALYRKWRPQTFDAIVGQEHVMRTLRNALRTARIGHAYLFSGPRGTGKTTTARLLAKAVNCLAENPKDRPCNECSICQALNEGRLLDLIEIDAASNRGIDEIRELRERVGFRPNEARYKVYVIDEVHMLTEQAFNALLKTLEEPPPHIIFVLATTEPHKLPETILSRCQRFDFRRLTVDEIVGRLADLAERENLQFAPEALAAIARQATGSLRDAESLLDQLVAYSEETITLEQVQTVLGTGSLQMVSRLVDHLVNGDVAAGLDAINQEVDKGIAPGQLNRQVVEYLRDLMLLQVGDGEQLLNAPQEIREIMSEQAAQMSFKRVVQAVKIFNQAERALKGSLHPQLPLELAFIEAATLDLPEPIETPSRRVSAKTETAVPVQAATSGETNKEPASAERRVNESRSALPPSESLQTGNLSLEKVRSSWEQVLTVIRPQSALLQAVLRDGWAERIEGNVIIIGFDSKREFHKNKVSETENRQIVVKAFEQVLERPCQLRCELIAQKPSLPVQAQPAPDDSPSRASWQAAAQDPVIQAAVEEMGAQVVTLNDDS